MKLLLLVNSDKPALVDDDIYEQIQGKHWRLIKVSNGAVYVGWKSHKAGKDLTVYLHRLVVGNPKGMVDHINGDPFDDRRENLRIVTNSQNQMNSKGKAHSSIYKNVYWNKQLEKWKVQFTVDGQSFFIGYFEEERIAGEVAELNRPIFHGEYARSDFPNALINITD